MNIKVVPVNRAYAVIIDGKRWRRFHFKADANAFVRDIQRDPSLARIDTSPMEQRARCKQCGTEFRHIAGFLNSTKGSFPDYESFPKCPACGSFRETVIVKEGELCATNSLRAT